MTLPRITLLTDFGTRDGYVGAMKATLASGAPGVGVDDIAHDVPRGDVVAAAHALDRYWRRYPKGTVHLIVIDPGVGTARRALACAADGRVLVAPDNGVLSPVVRGASEWACVSVGAAPGNPVSATFHGRDLFALVASELASGRSLSSFGPPVTDPVLLEVPLPTRSGDEARGEVVMVDRFGNVATNLPGSWAATGGRIEVGDRALPLVRTYGDVASGEPLALIDSEGRIEVAVRDDSAAARLDIGVGTPVRLLPP